MKKTLEMILFFVILTVLLGCSQQTTIKPEAGCPDGYFKYMAGKCCKDLNKNQVCDEDEVEEEQAEEEPEEKIIEAPSETKTPEPVAELKCKNEKDEGEQQITIYSGPELKKLDEVEAKACLTTKKETKTGRMISQKWVNNDAGFMVEEKYQFGRFVSREAVWITEDGYDCHAKYDRNENVVEKICE